VDDLPDETRLAHARLADDRHQLAMPLRRAAGRLAELLDLRIPAHEAGQPARLCGVEPRAEGPGPRQLVDVDGRVQPLDRYRTERLDRDEALGEGQRIRRQQDGPRPGHLLHARGQVGSLPDRGVVHVEIRADRADHHLTRIEPHTNLDLNPMTPEHGLGVALHRLQHPERGVARADGVILMGERARRRVP
jgi:hypothetical protein